MEKGVTQDSESGGSSARRRTLPLRNSVFTIIGPVMTGPSSSHTYAPLVLGRLIHDVIVSQDAQVTEVNLALFGSFAEIEKSIGSLDPHGTKHAIVAGLLGRRPGDCISSALEDAPFSVTVSVGADPVVDGSEVHTNRFLVEVSFATPGLGDFTLRVSAISLGGGRLLVEAPGIRTEAKARKVKEGSNEA